MVRLPNKSDKTHPIHNIIISAKNISTFHKHVICVKCYYQSTQNEANMTTLLLKRIITKTTNSQTQQCNVYCTVYSVLYICMYYVSYMHLYSHLTFLPLKSLNGSIHCTKCIIHYYILYTIQYTL